MPPTSPRLLRCLLIAALVAPSAALAAEPIGFVTEVRGTAQVTAPAEAARTLRANDPVHAGERIATGSASQMGLLVGTYYAGLDEKTIVELDGLTRDGAPEVDLQMGHVRLVDGDGNGGAVLDTPGLRIADAGADLEGFAFGEKSWLVSMGCPSEAGGTSAAGQQLKNGLPAGDGLVGSPGDCLVSKPGEPLYTAKAGHDPMGILTGTPPPAARGLAGDPGPRFGGPLPPVAVGLTGPTPIVATSPPRLLATPALTSSQRLPCDVGGMCATAPPPTVVDPPPPIIPPINPPVPGLPPGIGGGGD